MTLHELKLLHAYNAWASNRIFDACARIASEEYHRDLKSSHRSIHGTLLHMVAAEKIWLSRFVGPGDASLMTEEDAPTLQTLRAVWETVGHDMAKFLGSASDRKLQGTFVMTTARGETFTQIYWQAFQHVVDHSTYHRGQVVALLRQIGHTPPSTGLINFYRETAKLGSA